MTHRSDLMITFLTDAGWGSAKRNGLAGDASNRRYERLQMGTKRAVLMDAPPAKGEDVRPFVDVTQRLRSAGLSAPNILAQDKTHGFLLLEDLGDDLFARVLETSPDLETTLYAAATDVLISLFDAPAPDDLAPYSSAYMGEMAALAAVWYHPDPTLQSAIQAEITELCERHLTGPKGLIQRDYHAENLLWLPQREGIARVGLLDYQDAMLGPISYDLVSLLQDARRDVSPSVQDAMVARFADATNTPRDVLDLQIALLGAQRNLRIIGVFARLWLRDGKSGYLALIPRVWDHLQRDLAHPELSKLAQICTSIPAPAPEVLQQIQARR